MAKQPPSVLKVIRENQLERRKRLKEAGYVFVALELPPELAASLKDLAAKEHRKLTPQIIHELWRAVGK